jgi:hypothetical protein
MTTFAEYVHMREGLWLDDKNALVGMSKFNPFPATKGRLKWTKPKPVKPTDPFKPAVQQVTGSRKRVSYDGGRVAGPHR